VITIAAGVTVKVAVAVRVLSAFETAVTVTTLGVGTEVGAVYNPFESIVPMEEFPPAMPLICQLTPVFVEKLTVAENCRVCAATTDTLAGFTTMGNAMVTLASAVLLVSATDATVIVTVEGLGTADGAVYTPVPLIVPNVELPPATPFTRQITPVLLAFCTVSVNC
jgi:hypothetical protein